MIKLSKRLATIASFCAPKDKVVDVGCDHGLLSIYLYAKVKEILATDINPYSLEMAQKNFAKYDTPIKTVLCDGINFSSIIEYDTLVIAGMGASTIIHILEDKEKLQTINKIIISSHNHQELVRSYLNKIGFYLQEETVIYDKHYYTIMVFLRGKKRHSKKLNKYGLIKDENLTYYEYLLQKDKDIFYKNPSKELEEEINFYQKIIEKIAEQK